MNAAKTTQIMLLLIETFPSLTHWVQAQYMNALFKDFVIYDDEPSANIGMVEMGACIEAFADAIAQISYEEMQNIMSDMLQTEWR